MDVQQIRPVKEPYKPTTEQLARDEVLRRFNRRFVYWPIGIASLISFSIVLTLILYIIFAPSTEYIVTISAVADVVIILMACTAILIISIFLAVAGAVLYQARTKGVAPIRQLQILFWRVESFIIRIHNSILQITPLFARPFIVIGGAIAYIKALLLGIPRIFKRG
jgi:hypothetical protein